MENGQSNYFLNNILNKSNSLPIYNTRNKKGNLPFCFFRDSNNGDSRYIYSPDDMKILMMEDKLKRLERENNQQVDKINALMSYQISNRPKNNLVTPFVPQPNILVLPNNSFIHPLNYVRELDNYYNLEKKKNTRKIFLMKLKNQEKDSKLEKYKKEIKSLRDLLKLEMFKKNVNKNIYNKVYIPMKEEINNLKNKINNDIQKRIEDNNAINKTINEIQNNYDEIKNVLIKKLDNLELKQQKDFGDFKNEFMNKIKNNQEQEKKFRNKLSEQLIEEIKTKRKLDEIKYRRELDEIKRRQDIEDMENNKLKEEMKFNKFKNNILNQRRKMPKIIKQYPTPFYQTPMYLW